ncbi:23S rRNA (cytidine1920-2'-O)/16S rRNA (cytidine1409-2'-O)-methyltransferase [Desulfonatronum thiosulfatophilum]|uniref:23S rRNA (Cytidine1920-2'-O)/16S rRNA (Cytidine1409-2'-O)-methyltransferase n=1 Tax=Desulfonatronum thiosulfatophilum TaxID=617002 RepID=A0A1G6CLJ9_9BACT|nr:TlyA family RNA methyltransferase [Desulfonatronum thiosulfatophilum]SDB33761.1 23S rRNA (cytidine1920-2'-O)/16S rRNA (cytidine1409-2'-O)-methyltransferase [Desulfonatronum thiosulfatophilum]
MGRKIRADLALVEQGLVESREKAERLIMAGRVSCVVDGSPRPVGKPGQGVAPDAELRVVAGERFVSRGGEKLLTALEHFAVNIQGRIALDVGASTGGFTDCLLQHGALKVYAVDVGKGQLDWKLRQDSRVVNLEGVNFRHAGPDLLPELVDVITADCSFISLRLILPPCLHFCKPSTDIFALIKPQFEADPGAGERGVIRDPLLREQILKDVTKFAHDELGLVCRGIVPSKILGPKGNQEYLAWFRPAETGDAGLE